MTLKSVSSGGMLKDVNDNFADIMPLDTHVGLGVLRVARFEFDTAEEDSADRKSVV